MNVVALEELEAEAATLFQELREFGENMDPTETAANASIFRTRVALLEKLVSVKERIFNVKQMKEFQDRVLAVVEEHLSPDQRTKVMEELRNG